MLYKNIQPVDGYLVDVSTGNKVVFYECDPKKNIGCDKLMCGAHSAADFDGNTTGCTKTTVPEYQKEDGRKWYAVLKPSPDGGEPYWGREYID